MSRPIITDSSVDQTTEVNPTPTLEQVAAEIASDASQAAEYLANSVVPFGGE